MTIAHIAPDLLEPDFDRAAVVRRIKAKDSAVQAGAPRPDGRLRHRQHLRGRGAVAGAGARGAAASALTRPRIGALLDHAAAVMREALGQGGTSFDALYVNVNGASGYFDRSLAAYGQEGRPCRRCGTPVRREQFMNRSSFSCPRCPAPAATVRAAGSA